ncbi:MAG: hypothetical protein ACYSWP_24805, partial [Planctomycetota bacterium]
QLSQPGGQSRADKGYFEGLLLSFYSVGKMKMKKYEVLALLLLVSSGSLGAVKKSKPLLPDGFYLARIEGRLIASEPNEILEANQDRWFFELASKITDGKTTLVPGTIIEFLPSSALEGMINDASASSGSSFLLRARITKYHSKNYRNKPHLLTQTRKNLS